MAAPDNTSLAGALARFEPNPSRPDERIARIAARLDEYEAAGTDTAPFAAYDWSSIDQLGEAGMLSRDIQPLYDDFADGLFLPDDEWQKLSAFARETADSELHVGLTGRLEQILDAEGRAIPMVRYNPAPPGNVFLDRLAREQRMTQLNPEPQFEQAVQNIEDMVRRGASEDGVANVPRDEFALDRGFVPDDMVNEMYWGLDFGASLPIGAPLGDRVFLDQALREAAERLSSEFDFRNPHDFPPGDVVRYLAGRKWEKLKIDHQKANDWFNGNPYRLKLNGEENPAFLAMIGAGNELPATLSGITGETMPAIALTTPADGLTLFVDQYDVTHAHRATRQADHFMRNMFPGPLGAEDSIPRWLPGRPLQLRSFDAVDGAVLDNPTAVVETMHSGSYPGFKPGDYIVFDHNGKVPPWAEVAERMPGGAAREAPVHGVRRLGLVDLTDGDTTRRLLEENSWAVFSAPSRNLVGRLRQNGFQPIPLRGGDEPAILVFGDPDVMSPRGSDFAQPSFTNAGRRTNLAPATEWVVPNRAGERVGLNLPTERAADTGTPRASQAVARYVYKVDQREAHQIAKLAADLENSGAANLAIYSRQPLIDGFEVARDRVYRGPQATVKVVRTADAMVGDPHSVPVHVREGSGLPTRAPRIDPNAINIDAVQFEDTAGAIRMRAETEGDLMRTFRDAAEVAQVHGYDGVVVDFEDKHFILHKPDSQPKLSARPELIDAPTTTRPPAATDPNVNGVRIIQRYGPGDKNRLSPETVADISIALDRFMDLNPEVAEIWNLSWVSVGREMSGRVKGGSYVAATNMHAPGSGIHLNEDRWLDEERLGVQLRTSHDIGHMAGDGTVRGVILHELGHVMAATVRLLETGKAGRIGEGGSALYDELAPKFAKWAEEPGALSGRGRLDMDEAIAEAVTDVITGANQGVTPGKFSASMDIYMTVAEHLEDALPNRQKFWGAVAPDANVVAETPFSPPEPGQPRVTVVGDINDALEELPESANFDVREEHIRRIDIQTDSSEVFEPFREGLSSYFGPFYDMINRRMRGRAPRFGESLDEVDDWIADVREAFGHGAPFPDSLEIVYRGVGRTDRKRFFASSLVPGTEFVDRGFVSVTMNPWIASGFSPGEETSIFRITIANEARDVNVIAGVEREAEWLLPEGSVFRVGNIVEERGGRGAARRLIDLEWLGLDR